MEPFYIYLTKYLWQKKNWGPPTWPPVGIFLGFLLKVLMLFLKEVSYSSETLFRYSIYILLSYILSLPHFRSVVLRISNVHSGRTLKAKYGVV